MTTIASGSDHILFTNRQQIESYLLEKILANTNQLVGSEWEVFLVKQGSQAISPADGQKAFTLIKQFLILGGYIVQEIFDLSTNAVIALDVDDFGRISTEAGHQFEFATSVCRCPEEILEKNKVAFLALKYAADILGYELACAGHISGYADSSTGIESSRSRAWRHYYDHTFGDGAEFLRDAQLGTASVQVTLDSGGEQFHEYFRSLLILEPILSLYYSNSVRSYVWGNAYGRYLPQQVNPLTNVWNSQNPQEAITAIAERLLALHVPFLPDQNSEIYRALYSPEASAPSVEQLMHGGRLTEKALNNIGGFFYSRPAFRNFSRALLEVRGIDSQPMPETIASISKIVTTLVYDSGKRRALLDDYSHLRVNDIQMLHQLSNLPDKSHAFSEIISGKTVSTLISDILARVGKERFVADRIHSP